MQLSDDERKAFETYLFAGEDQVLKEKSLDNLVEGSIPYYYLYFINKLKSGGIAALTDKDNEMFVKFTETKNNKNTPQAKQVKLWHTLLKIDAETDQNKKQELIEQFEKDYLHFDFKSHVKPAAPPGMKGDESSQEEDEQKHSLPANFFLNDNDTLIKSALERMNKRIDVLKQQDQTHEQQIKQVNQSILEAQYEVLQELLLQGDAIYHELDFSLFKPEAVYRFATRVFKNQRNSVASIQNKSFFTAIKNHIDQFRSNDPEEFKFFTLDDKLVRSFTIKQLDILSTLDKWFSTDENFIGAYFEKQFSEELSAENQEMWSTQEKLNNLERLYNLASSQGLPKAFQKEFLYEILSLGTKTDSFSMTHFREYVELSKKYDQVHIFANYEQKMQQQNQDRQEGKRSKVQTNWRQYCSNVRKTDSSQTKVVSLMTEYLEHFCVLQNGNLNNFREDFGKQFLKEIERKTKVYLAKDGLKSLDENEIGLEYFKSIADQVELEFCKQNKEIFEVEEEVVLLVNIKNIKSLHVKIFEFNTETYYKKNLMPFNTSVNLDGLDASESLQFAYEHASNMRHREEFRLPQLTNKVGLFIVEMIGNGVSARAVIKKGSLSLVHRSTVAGHLAYILDAQKNICYGEKTGVWFDFKYYPADPNNGRIFIPYGKSDLSSKVIMIHGDFAQLGDFTQKTESYSFSAQFYLHQESVLVGALTNIIVRAQLLINGRKTTLSMLKNVKVVLTTFNYIDNIPVTKTFQDLNFINDQELSVSFQVPPNLKDISIALSCEVLNATTKKMQSFSANHQFNVISPNSASIDLMAMPYLKKVKGNYHLYILGKNGEPRSKQEVSLSFKHRVQGQSSGNHRISRITNRQGVINLGTLVDVYHLTAESDIGARAQWNLDFQSTENGQNFSYPQTIEALEGESVELPISLRAGQEKLDRKWLSFIRQNNGVIVEDWFEKIKLEHCGDKNTGYHKISVESLQQGIYYLEFLSGSKQQTCQITVHKGTQWQHAEGFILKKYCLQENMQSQTLGTIQSVQIHATDDIPDERGENKQNPHEVTVTVENCTQAAHLHAFAHHFIPGDQTQFTKQIRQLQRSQFSQSIFPFAKWENLFQSNRHMADEIRYVFDRKQLETQLGNTLDRPTLLSKKNFIQKTTQEEEILSAGNNFAYMEEKQQERHFQQQAIAPESYYMQNAVPQSYMMSNMQQQSQRIQNANYYMQSRDEVEFGGMAMGDGSGHNRRHGGLVMLSTEPSEFQNFIKCPPLQKLNLQASFDDKGVAKFDFKCNLTPYSQLVLILVDKEFVTQKNIDLDTAEIQKRDLRQQNTLNPEEGLTESRITKPLLENEQDFIRDITSTEVQIVDDLIKVSEILSEIRKVKGTNNGEFSAFEFVKKWHTLSTNEKDRYFSDYYSHELNFFIYKRDPSYFKQTVRPFLQCKMEKQFFDHYLLGNTREVVKNSEFHLISKLNVLEKCMLIETLIKSGDTETAKNLADKMHQECQAQKSKDKDSVNFDNKIFDLVLNLNTLNESQGDLQNLRQRKKQQLNDMNEKSAMRAFAPPPGSIALEMSSRVNMLQEQSYDMHPAMAMRSAPKMMMEQFQTKSMPMMKKKAANISRSANRMAVESDDEDQAIYNQRNVVIQKQQFEEVEATSEYRETNYYKKLDDNFANLVQLNQYWCDYARYLVANKKEPFLSSNFTDCSEDERSSFFVLCTLDLQIVNQGNHQYKPDEQRGVIIVAGSNILLFKKEIKACGLDLSRSDIMIIHRYKEEHYNSHSSKEDESGKPDEFLARTAYACEVVITNVAPKSKQFSLLYQVPEGALPLRQTKYIKSQHISLMPYTTQKVVFYFYFPTAGKYQHFPSNISVDGVVTARGGANDLIVVDSRKLTKIQSFQDLLHAGTKEDILNFLKSENLYSFKKNFSFHSILWLLKDRQFFQAVIEILRERNIFEPSVWRYAFYHKEDAELMRECLMMSPPSDLVFQLGAYFKSNMIDVDQINSDTRNFNKLLEYHPMVNSRAHLIGKGRQILNTTFRQTYDRFLSSLIQKRSLSIEDQLIFVYYLQLQDRVQEAINIFRQIPEPKEENATLKIQYDYLQAYFDFFSGAEDGFKNARRIVQKYDNYPITAWRMMFLTIADQLNEFDGEFDNEEEMIEVDAGANAQDALIREQRKQNKKTSQKREPNMSVEIDLQGTLKLETTNIQQVQVQYYIINAELLFSRQPFLKDNTEGFSYVKPIYSLNHAIFNSSEISEEELNQYTRSQVPIPEKLLNQNMVIEVTSGDLQKFLTFYSNQLKVTVLEQYGELKVTHATTGKALPQTYVKVFSQKKQGGEIFYRDGYTDIRGKIEYAQTSGDKLKDVKKFAILVQHDSYGSKILECDPPKGVTGNDQPISSSDYVQPSFAT